MLPNIKVIKAGACTTIQDLGRIGYQKFGIPVAGVMDEFSASIANFLVGNKKEEAVLELTYLGPTLLFQEDMLISITGADVSPKINNIPAALWESITVKKGDTLSFGSVKSGVRAYIAFAGSIDVPVVNGSKSTLMKSKIGGFQGRMLQNGDELAVQVRENAQPKKLPTQYIPSYPHTNDIFVCLGPQDDYFTEQGIADFFHTEYHITANADRMGIRLDGAAIAHKEKADIISDAAVMGSIQVPADGKPIVLMADRQTTGGYTKIGTVIKEDIIKLAQMGPKDTIRFHHISLEDAQKKYHAFYQHLEKIRCSIQTEQAIPECSTSSAHTIIDSVLPALMQGNSSVRKFKVTIDGITHIVAVEELTQTAAATIAGTQDDTAINAKEKITMPIAGTIAKIAVKKGERVKAGSLLFVFEAMKMENEVCAPCDGTIGSVYKTAGEAADADELVLVIRAEGLIPRRLRRNEGY